MKTNKIMATMLSLILVLSMLPFIAAGDVGALSYWVDTMDESHEVMRGTMPEYIVQIESFAPKFNLYVDLYKEDGTADGQHLRLLHEDLNVEGDYIKILKLDTENLSAGRYQIVTHVDSKDYSADAHLFLNVVEPSPTNLAPVITSVPVMEVDEGDNYRYNLEAFDADGDDITYSFVQKPSWITGTKINNGLFVISGTAPVLNSDYNYGITVKAKDVNGAFTLQGYALTVKDSETQPPQPTSVETQLVWDDHTEIKTIELGETAEFSYSATSENEASMKLKVDLFRNGAYQTNLVSKNTESANIGLTSYTLNNELSDTGNYEVRATVTGESGATHRDEIKLIVEYPTQTTNTAPVMDETADQETEEGETLSFTVSATDAENDQLTYEVRSKSDSRRIGDILSQWYDRFRESLGFNEGIYTFDESTGVFTFSPNYDFVKHPAQMKDADYEFRAFDGQLYSGWMAVNIDVFDVNRNPTVEVDGNDPYQENEEIEIEITVTDEDTEDNAEIVGVEGVPEWADVHINGDGTITIEGTPDCDDSGTYEIRITVSDGITTVEYVYVLVVEETCTDVIFGCTDEDYLEYDENANIDDGSCQTLIVEGCTDSAYEEYNPAANVDDGSCTNLAVEDILGCMDSSASNYNPLATLAGNCNYAIPTENVFFKVVHIVPEELRAGEYANFIITVENNAETDLEDLRVSVIAPELGLRKSSDKFDLDTGDWENLHLTMRMPDYAWSGDYLLKFVVANDHFHDATYRQVTIQ